MCLLCCPHACVHDGIAQMAINRRGLCPVAAGRTPRVAADSVSLSIVYRGRGAGGREKELRRNSRLPSREYRLRVVTSGFNPRIVLLSYRIGTIIIDSFLDRLAAGLTITVAGVLVAATHVYVHCLLRSD